MTAPAHTTEEQRVRVHVQPAGGYRFSASFPDVPAAAPILLDEPPPLGESTGPNPAGVLAAAIGSCLAASLTFCLRRSRVEGSVEADVDAELTRNPRGRFRVAGVSVELLVNVSANDSATLERCRTLFEDFCIVTESVRHGIPVTLAISESSAAPIARSA